MLVPLWINGAISSKSVHASCLMQVDGGSHICVHIDLWFYDMRT
jgi:hypothetical protein